MNPRRQLEEEIDIGDTGNENESRLIECEGLSMNNLGDIDLLNAKYDEIKAQLPGHIHYYNFYLTFLVMTT